MIIQLGAKFFASASRTSHALSSLEPEGQFLYINVIQCPHVFQSMEGYTSLLVVGVMLQIVRAVLMLIVGCLRFRDGVGNDFEMGLVM